MTSISEILRLPSPAPKPQGLAFDGTRLWIGSRETCHLWSADPAQWSWRDEGEAPGVPYGITVVGDELRVLCGEGADDTRVIRRFVPGHGFKNADAIACPDDTGSQLSYDGDRLYVSQWYNRKLISLDEQGRTGTVIEVPHGICGQTIVGGRFFLVTTDEEDTGPYWLSRVDARDGTPHSADIATIAFAARALAYDGERFWTNHRENNEIVAFTALDVW